MCLSSEQVMCLYYAFVEIHGQRDKGDHLFQNMSTLEQKLLFQESLKILEADSPDGSSWDRLVPPCYARVSLWPSSTGMGILAVELTNLPHGL